MKAQVLILDYGSQYTQLIARAVREIGVYCEILPGTVSYEKVNKLAPKAIILSGGPSSVHAENAPLIASGILQMGVPILGICYGMQLIARGFGGEVVGWGRDASGVVERKESSKNSGSQSDGIREFGRAQITVVNPIGIFTDYENGKSLDVWMSHGDKVSQLPVGFKCCAVSSGSPVAAFTNEERKIFGVQFHPEVHHTPCGKDLLRKFLFDSSGLKPDWDSACFISQTVENVRQQVKEGSVVCGLSGGVDSTVAAVLVHKAIGSRLHCIFVDNGLLRQDEAQEVMKSMSDLGLNIKMVDASEKFLGELAGVIDPEQKRKIIGRVFIEVFEEEAKRISDVHYLVQGTLYPDVIESVSVVGSSAVIKSHHNVGGLIEDMKLQLIEPLRELFKDEVRIIGHKLEIPAALIDRQPFPGPGLAVRILGDITKERLSKLRMADKIVREEVLAAGLNKIIWQAFAVLLSVQSVGVMGDGRTFDECIAIRAVTSRDGMTADWYYFEPNLLRRISSRIVNETKGVNRVVLDISTKPPATIEWE